MLSPSKIKKKCWYSVGFALQRIGVPSLGGNNSDVVLTFHSIGDGYYDDISPEALEQILNYVKSKYQITDLETMVEEPSDQKRVCITFDDGYRGFYSHVVPILRKMDIPATVFIIAISASEDSFRHNEEYDYEYMNFSQLKELVKEDLVSIGNHTMTHPDLTEISDEKKLRHEIVDSKEKIETELNISVDSFCYPGNKYNSKSHKIVKQSHKYAVCGGGRSKNISTDTDPYLIPRINGAKEISKLNWDINDLGANIAELFR